MNTNLVGNELQEYRDRMFWKWITVGGLDQCWPWNGACDKNGYGKVTFNKKDERAHRHAFERAREPIPARMVLAHICDNPPCCNPLHLFITDIRGNALDAMAKCRLASGSRNGNSKLTEELVIQIKKAIDRGESNKGIALTVGVTRVTVRDIRLGKTWRHISISKTGP